MSTSKPAPARATYNPPRPTRSRLPALQTFETVARHLSITRAADELFVTPGAVSRQVRQLEESLGVDLLVRQHRRIALTQQGERLAACVASAFNQIDQLLLDILGESRAKRLRLRLMPGLALRWLVPRLPSFYALHPDIAIDLSTEASEVLSLDNVDFAIRLGDGKWEDAESDHLFDDALLPVCSPKVGRALKTPQDLEKQVWLHSMIRPDAWGAWLAGRGLQDIRARSDMHFANAAILCQAAAEGLGVAIVQRSYVENDLAEGRLVAPFPAYGRPNVAYWLVCPRRKAGWPTIQLFRAWIRETLKPRTTERARARSPLSPLNLRAGARPRAASID